MSSEQLGQLAIDCRSAMEGVRGALINLYASVECDPSDFQAAAKRFGLNKTLTWKFSKIISSDDPYSAIQHLPGEAGIGIFLSTFASNGAPAGAVEAVREAMAEFSRVVEEHATGRDDFNLMLDSMGLGAPDRQLEASRELAFRGNSGICGLQAAHPRHVRHPGAIKERKWIRRQRDRRRLRWTSPLSQQRPLAFVPLYRI